MDDARISSRPLRFAAVLLAVTVAGATSLGCSGGTATDPQTGGGTSLPGPEQGGNESGGTPAVGAPEKSPAPSSSGSVDAAAPAPDAGTAPDHDSGATTGTGKQLGETCAQNSDCQSGECFVGGMASYCSLRCTPANAATVCVAPFTGVCNNHGYCRK
jgi:hypothetical protein